MTEIYQSNGQSVPSLPTDHEKDASSTKPHEALTHHQDPAASLRDNESDVPWPFGSESSIDGGNRERRSIGNRILDAFHLSKSRKRGYSKGRVDQIIRSLNDYPAGYCKVAAVEDLDSDFSIYRKFGFLHHYALLHLQDELVEIQEELERLDKWEFSDGNAKNLVSRRRDYADGDSRRKELLAELHIKLAQYDESLLRMQQIQAIKRPTKRAQRNLHNVISNTQSLVASEADWIRQGPDLAALGTNSENGWLDTFLEDVLNGVSRTMTLKLDVRWSPSRLDMHSLLPEEPSSSDNFTGDVSELRAENQDW